MSRKRHDVLLAASLVLAVFLWGGNNTGTKLLVASWPPVWTGGSRFVCAGLLLLGILRFTKLLGDSKPVTRAIRFALWYRGGLSLAIYIVVFNWALRFTAASHVALYLGAAPVWALLWEGLPRRDWSTVRRYGAAAIALSGVYVLFRPAMEHASGSWRGEVLALLASVLWTNYGHQCRTLAAHLTGPQVSAHTMWRAGSLLMPIALVEVGKAGLVWRWELGAVQLYCIVAGGVAAFAIWSNALRHWPTSQVLLFNNLIPLSTTGWAHAWLGEPVSRTFWVAMLLVIGGVVLGQSNWERYLAPRSVPPD